MPMTEDFNAFFNVKEHGTNATFKTATIVGVLEDQYVTVNGVESVKPTFMCASSDVSGVVHGDTIAINSVTYTILGDQQDGTGVVLLILRAPS